MRTTDELNTKATQAAKTSSIILCLSFIIAGMFIMSGIDGYMLESITDINAAVVPDSKIVTTAVGAWMTNYGHYPLTLLAPALAIAGAVMVYFMSIMDQHGAAFIASCVSVSCVILTAGFAMFPFVMPSSTHIHQSLTAWDATSSELTLSIMFWVAIIFVPIILLYSLWTYRKMWGRLDTQFIQENTHSTY
jgi:cytochrome d ubiquinol oxidase subunit II